MIINDIFTISYVIVYGLFLFLLKKILNKEAKKKKYKIFSDNTKEYFPVSKTFYDYIYMILLIELIYFSVFPYTFLLIYWLGTAVTGLDSPITIGVAIFFLSLCIFAPIFFYFSALRHLYFKCIYSRDYVENKRLSKKKCVFIKVDDVVKILLERRKIDILNSLDYRLSEKYRYIDYTSKTPQLFSRPTPRGDVRQIISREVDEEYYPDTPAYVLSDGAKEVVLFLAPALNEQQERDLHEYIQWLIKRNGLIKTGENVWEKQN